MQEETMESWNILNKYVVLVIILALVFVSFKLGVLTAKVKLYEKELGIDQSSSKNINAERIGRF